MSHDIETALDDCLAMLRAGASVDACLAVHSAHAAALRPLLELGVAVQGLPAPRARSAAVQANRERMMAAVARKPAHATAVAPLPISKPPLSRYTERISTLFRGERKKEGKDMGFIIRFATAAVVTLMAVTTAGAGTAAVASASSLPGDALYPVKRTIEDVQLFLTMDETARQQFQAELEVRRRNEVQAVIQERRRVEVQFWGTLTAYDASQWVVDGLTVLVNSETRVKGEPVEGAKVHVLATTQADGSILAKQLVVRKGSPARQGPQTTPGPKGTPQPQGTPQQQRNRQQNYGTPQGTPNPTGTQSQSRNRQQNYGTPQATPNPTGTQSQSRNRQQSYGTPQATPNSTGAQNQWRQQQQYYGTPQATPSATQNQERHGR